MTRGSRALRHVTLTAFIVGGVALGMASPGFGEVRSQQARSKVSAVVASFDPYVGKGQRFIVGIVTRDNRTLAFGEVEMHFAYAGTKEQPLKEVTLGDPVVATYRPIPGQKPAPATARSRLVAPSTSRGVYGTDAAAFDRPGLWGVLIEGTNGGRKFTTDVLFEVSIQPQVTAPGEPAPPSDNPLPGAAGITPKAIDSRAAKGTVPDPLLHAVTVADAIRSGKPTMVVVSTPVYCVSQFCGPITDTVDDLARRYSDRMNFVHLEVWSDFQNQQLNAAAGQWILRRDNGDANEPWVFVVDRNGVVDTRFDNVATQDDLESSIAAQL